MPSTGAAKSGDETSVFAEHEGELAMLGAFGVLLAGRSGGGRAGSAAAWWRPRVVCFFRDHARALVSAGRDQGG